MKLYKVQAYVLDLHNDFKDADDLERYIKYHHRFGLYEHVHIATADIGEWDDDHPLNIVNCPEAEFKKYFKEN